MTDTVKWGKIYIIKRIIPNIDNTFAKEIMSNTYKRTLCSSMFTFCFSLKFSYTQATVTSQILPDVKECGAL